MHEKQNRSGFSTVDETQVEHHLCNSLLAADAATVGGNVNIWQVASPLTTKP